MDCNNFHVYDPRLWRPYSYHDPDNSVGAELASMSRQPAFQPFSDPGFVPPPYPPSGYPFDSPYTGYPTPAIESPSAIDRQQQYASISWPDDCQPGPPIDDPGTPLAFKPEAEFAPPPPFLPSQGSRQALSSASADAKSCHGSASNTSTSATSLSARTFRSRRDANPQPKFQKLGKGGQQIPADSASTFIPFEQGTADGVQVTGNSSAAYPAFSATRPALDPLIEARDYIKNPGDFQGYNKDKQRFINRPTFSWPPYARSSTRRSKNLARGQNCVLCKIYKEGAKCQGSSPCDPCIKKFKAGAHRTCQSQIGNECTGLEDSLELGKKVEDILRIAQESRVGEQKLLILGHPHNSSITELWGNITEFNGRMPENVDATLSVFIQKCHETCPLDNVVFSENTSDGDVQRMRQGGMSDKYYLLSLPSYDQMDEFMRIAMRAKARAFPDDPGCCIDAFLLAYVKYPWNLPFHDLVNDVLRIRSLKCFLDNRRPVLLPWQTGMHVLDRIDNAWHKVEAMESNDYQLDIFDSQLSYTARTQLASRAVEGITELQARVCDELNTLMHQRLNKRAGRGGSPENDAQNNSLILGICARALGLSELERIERYSLFGGDAFKERVQRHQEAYDSLGVTTYAFLRKENSPWCRDFKVHDHLKAAYCKKQYYSDLIALFDAYKSVDPHKRTSTLRHCYDAVISWLTEIERKPHSRVKDIKMR